MKDFLRLVLASVVLALVAGAAGCKSNQNPTSADQNSAADQAPAQDPANANVAPVSNASDNTAAPSGAYTQDQNPQPAAPARPAPRPRASAPQPSGGQYASDQYPTQPDQNADQYSSGDNYDNYGGAYTPVEYATQAPPPLPAYQQPPCPGDGYIWTPGSWRWDNGQGYYWAPGAWVRSPYVGALWTPGWWGSSGNRYGWHQGYWGRHVGYYGGVPYGYGYNGSGYEGGYWHGNDFAYNRTVNNVNTTVVKNVYVYKVTNVVDVNITRVSYNGGRGGIQERPRPAEIVAMREQHNPPMETQVQLAQQARSDRQNFARYNNNRPQMVAVAHPVQADHDVRPPAEVHYQAAQQQQQQREQQQRTQQEQQQQRAQQQQQQQREQQQKQQHAQQQQRDQQQQQRAQQQQQQREQQQREQQARTQQQHAAQPNRPQPKQDHQAATEQKRAPMPEQRTQQRPSEPARPAP
jgi:WXXGXW repeat (2 copies)